MDARGRCLRATRNLVLRLMNPWKSSAKTTFFLSVAGGGQAPDQLIGHKQPCQFLTGQIKSLLLLAFGVLISPDYSTARMTLSLSILPFTHKS